MVWISFCWPLLALWVLGFLVDFIKTFLFRNPELHQEAAGASRVTNKTISSKQSTVKACFNFLLFFYFLTDSEVSCLAMLAKPYPVSGPTPMPLIPNQLHCIQNSAHEVLGTILVT